MSKLKDQLVKVRDDYYHLRDISDEERNAILCALAASLEENIDLILTENKRDLARMDKQNPKYDRLELTATRIKAISNDLRNVAKLSSPLNQILSQKTLANGLTLKKVTVPLGVIGIIYEARPNVTIDAFSLCFKSGNCSILKGGSEAGYSNAILISLIHEALKKHGLSPNLAYLLPNDREAVNTLLSASGVVDVCIPRGSQELIDFVRNNAKVPILETGAGIVHTYFDQSGDIAKASMIINNAKTRRVSVCNALDTLIVHKSRLNDLIKLVSPLNEHKVQIFADSASYNALDKNYPESLLFRAKDDSFGQEFLDYKMAVKTVDSLDEAIEHITKYSSKHSEAIIAEDKDAIEKFMHRVDAAAIYANASTAFTDGGEFGMGAEIGISTQKLHARGPMGLNELTSYKWLVYGNGQIR